jgi:hypothetical protein
LTFEKELQLRNLAANLWNLGGNKYLDCVAHIGEILLARESSLRSKDISTLNRRRRNLLMTYLYMGRMAECETVLTDALGEIESLRPGHPEGHQLRILLAELRAKQGQHSLAEELCTKAIISQRSVLGLRHNYTWRAYEALELVLRFQNKFDEAKRLMIDFYLDIYHTISEALFPGLRAALAVCRRYIEVWMTESELDRLVGDWFVCDRPLGIAERNKLALSTVLEGIFRVEERLGVVPQVLKDLGEIMSLSFHDILSTFALLISIRIQGVRLLDSASLQQEALRVAKEFNYTKMLVPLWIFVYLNETSFFAEDFNWTATEQEFIHSFADAVTKGGHSGGAPRSSISTGTGSPGSALTVDRRHNPAQIDTFNGHREPYDHHTPMPSTVSSSMLVSPRSQPTSGATEWPALSRLVGTDPLASHSTLWNTEPYFSYQWSTAEGEQHLNDARPHDQFSPMVMDNPTPPFTFNMPLTPHASRMSPPPRPGQDSPAAAPSSVLIGHPDFPTPPNLFGLPHSPLPPSPSLGSGSSPAS